MTEATRDLFGFTPPQGDLFAGEAPRNDGIGRGSPDEARVRLLKILAEARGATAARSLDARTVRLYKTIFPQMARWLPDAERTRLCREFETELTRLELAG